MNTTELVCELTIHCMKSGNPANSPLWARRAGLDPRKIWICALIAKQTITHKSLWPPTRIECRWRLPHIIASLKNIAILAISLLLTTNLVRTKLPPASFWPVDDWNLSYRPTPSNESCNPSSLFGGEKSCLRKNRFSIRRPTSQQLPRDGGRKLSTCSTSNMTVLWLPHSNLTGWSSLTICNNVWPTNPEYAEYSCQHHNEGDGKGQQLRAYYVQLQVQSTYQCALDDVFPGILRGTAWPTAGKGRCY